MTGALGEVRARKKKVRSNSPPPRIGLQILSHGDWTSLNHQLFRIRKRAFSRAKDPRETLNDARLRTPLRVRVMCMPTTRNTLPQTGLRRARGRQRHPQRQRRRLLCLTALHLRDLGIGCSRLPIFTLCVNTGEVQAEVSRSGETCHLTLPGCYPCKMLKDYTNGDENLDIGRARRIILTKAKAPRHSCSSSFQIQRSLQLEFEISTNEQR